jgi:hypothetical protein
VSSSEKVKRPDKHRTQYICQRMRCPNPISKLRSLHGLVVVGALLLVSCDRSRRPPDAEFIVAAGDSTYWVHSGPSGITMRGSPMVLARHDGRFYELYVVDDDRSFENALFVGQRLFQRDILSGDSIEVFGDTLVPALAEDYETRHPDARRLSADEEPQEEPAHSATSEVSVLGVHGPFLSLEYHVDTSGTGDDSWHMTRHAVLDLRTGKVVTLADVLGATEAPGVIARGRRLYSETLDSIRADRRPLAQRAAQSIARFRFDPNSFSITAPNGTLMIAFSAPGQGSGGEGFVLPIRPIPVAEPAWWAQIRDALPTATREREEHWSRGRYVVKAVYDTTARPVRLAIVDTSGAREFPIGGVSAPIHRIYWLDNPPLDRTQRAALTRAFDEAALYDDAARAEGTGTAIVSTAMRR